MQFNLSKACKLTRVSNAAAAAQTAINTSSVDMQGFDGATFIALFGTIDATAVTSVKLQQSQDDSSFADLAGTSISVAADDDNQAVMLDITSPQERYIRAVISRGTADSVVDGVVALQYQAGNEPVVHDTSSVVASEHHHSPSEGTA